MVEVLEVLEVQVCFASSLSKTLQYDIADIKTRDGQNHSTRSGLCAWTWIANITHGPSYLLYKAVIIAAFLMEGAPGQGEEED